MNGKNIHPWPPPAAAKQLYMCYAEDFVSNHIKKLGIDLESVTSISLANGADVNAGYYESSVNQMVIPRKVF